MTSKRGTAVSIVSLSCLALTSLLSAQPALAQPTGPHPRALLNADMVTAWRAQRSDPASPAARSIARCDDAIANPEDYADGQYQGFRWVEALSACLVARAITESAAHTDAAKVYLNALFDDRSTVGDGLGPAYNGGVGIVSQDTGYSMRTHGVFAALGYDWLHDALSAAERQKARTRFAQWVAFHQQPDTYQRAQPGANYHAGHLLALTLIAIGHADEMNAASAGTGSALYAYVRDEMWGEVMAGGVAPRGPLGGGDWLEGWQYGPLSVASYALAGRAMVEQGEAVPFMADYLAQVLERYVHGLTPDDRMFVGGDTGDDAPYLAASALVLNGVIAGHVADAVRAEARGELARLDLPAARDFMLFYEALAAAQPGSASPVERATLPTGYLAAGAGNYYARTAHDPGATWAVSQCRGSIVDHQHQNAGNLVVSRGADDLLVDPGPYGSLSTLTGNAPTMLQPHFNDNYQPSQGAFGEWWGGEQVPANQATRFLFARSTASGVHATRCDYTGQFRFRDVPSPILSASVRDVLLLPGDTGATTLVVDRVATTGAYASTPSPLLLRFRALDSWSESGASASTAAGGSTLLLRRVVGDASTSVASVPVGDCDGPRGSCRAGRFPASELVAEVAGPNPFAVHALDADATGGTPASIDVDSEGARRTLRIARETRPYLVTLSVDGSAVSAYSAPATPSTHVVLNPPAGPNVRVVGTANGDRCDLTLVAAGDGFASPPLVFALGDDCGATEDSTQPPRGTPPPPPPPGDGGVGGGRDGGMGGGGGGGGCSLVSAQGRGHGDGREGPNALAVVAGLVGLAWRQRRRRARRVGSGRPER
ncbi:MAG: hypothetical protein H6725_19310 [Sandaracinaceae bacterium]|nr:hypothetical protein [Sandaracinaceae bacterium]